MTTEDPKDAVSIVADEEGIRAEGDVTIHHRSAADFAPIAARIDEAREKAGLPKGGHGFFMGHVDGVGLVIDM